MNLVRADKLMH